MNAPKELPLVEITLEDGELVVETLKKGLRQNKVETVLLESVSGKVRDVTIAQFVGGKFFQKKLNDDFLITSISGKLSERGNLGYKGDVIVSLATGGDKTLGGVLTEARAIGDVTIKGRIVSFKQ